MDNEAEKCKCGLPLSESQFFGFEVRYRGMITKENSLACRNYPTCGKAEKEIE